jgi:hypothetical protein
MSRGLLKQIPSAQTTLQIDIKNAIQDHKFFIFITVIIGSNYEAPNYVPKYWVTPQPLSLFFPVQKQTSSG